MSDDLSIDDWRTFLQARITQEQGRDAEALPIFERLLAAHPKNPHLLASRTYALARLNRGGEAALSKIDTDYTEAGRTLVGTNDKPEAWISRLSSLLSELDQSQTRGFVAAGAMVAW
jgi:hypothetical protein